MGKGSRLSRGCGWSVRCAIGALAFALCASAFAGDGRNSVVLPSQQALPAKPKKICLVVSAGSRIRSHAIVSLQFRPRLARWIFTVIVRADKKRSDDFPRVIARCPHGSVCGRLFFLSGARHRGSLRHSLQRGTGTQRFISTAL